MAEWRCDVCGRTGYHHRGDSGCIEAFFDSGRLSEVRRAVVRVTRDVGYLTSEIGADTMRDTALVVSGWLDEAKRLRQLAEVRERRIGAAMRALMLAMDGVNNG